MFRRAILQRKYDEKDLKEALLSRKKFKRLIKTSLDLRKAVEHFTQHADEIIRYVLSDLEESKRLINSAIDLRKTSKQFMHHIPKQLQPHSYALMKQVLSDPERCKQLIKTTRDLKKISSIFPDCPVLQSVSTEEAIVKIEGKIESNKIRDAASTLDQARRDSSNQLLPQMNIPNEILVKIAIRTADLDKINLKEAEDAALQVIDKSFTNIKT